MDRVSATYGLIEVFPEPTLLLSKGGEVLAANPPAGTMLGLSTQELRGKRLCDLVADPPEDITNHLKVWSSTRALTPGSLSMIAADGRVIDCRCDGALIQSRAWDSTAIIFLRCVSKAVSNNGFLAFNGELETLLSEPRRVKQMEERDRFQSQLLDAVGQAVIATDSQGKIIYWNRAAERLYGWSVEEVMGRSIVEVTPSKELVERAEEIMSTLRAGRSWSGEFVVRRKDGTSFPAMVTDTPVYDEQGTLVGIIGVSVDITGLKETEQVRRSEKRFRSLIKNASDVITIIESDGTIRYVSPGVERALGYRSEEMIETNICNHMHSDDIDWASSLFAEVLDTPGIHSPIELRVSHKDGSWRYLEHLVNNLLEDPIVRGIVVNSRDITERREAEEALRKSEARFLAVFDRAGIGMALVDAEGYILESNPALQEMFGYGGEELKRMHFTDVTHPDDVAADEEGFKELMAGKFDHFHLEKRYIRKDGSLMWGHLTSSSIGSDGDKPRFMVGMVEDITERREAEEELKESEERFRSAFEDAPIGVALVDLDGRRFRVNQALCEMLGYSEEELLGKDYLENIHPDDHQISAQHLRQALEGEAEKYILERRYIHAEGHVVWNLSSVSLIQDTHGEPSHLVCLHQDITDRKRAEEEAYLLRTIALEVSEAEDLDSALRVVLQRVCGATDWVIGQAWIPSADGTVLECSPAWCTTADDLAGFRATNEGLVFARGEGLPGHTWATKRPVWTKDITQSNFARARIAAESGLRAAMDIPVLAGSEVVAVLDFFVFEQREKDERLIELVSSVAGQLGSAVQRKQAEEALRKSELRYRAVVEDQTELICRFLPDGTFTFVNEAFCRYFGKRREELVGHSLATLVPHLDREYVEERFAYLNQLSRENPTSEPIEYRLELSDGEVRWLQWIDRANFDEQDRLVEHQSVGRDITELKQAEKKLREAEELFRRAFDDVSVGMAMSSLDGRLLRVNRVLCEMLGRSEEELIGAPFRDTNHPDDAEITAEHMQRLLRGEISTLELEKRYLHADGHVVWGLLNASLLRDEEDLPLYFVCQIQNITERKRAEEELRNSEARNRAILQVTPDLMFRISRDGEYLDFQANDDAKLHVPREEIIGKNLREVMPPDLVTPMLRRVAETLDTGEMQVFEYQLPMADGVLDFEARLVVSGPNEVFSIVRDITERKRAEESLKRSLDTLLALNEAGQLLGSTLEPEEITTRLLGIMRRISGLTTAVISLRDENNGRLGVWRSIGLEDLGPKVRYAPEAREALEAALEKGATRIFALDDPSGAGPSVGLCLPFRMRERVVGVLEAYGAEGLADGETIEILDGLSAQAAIALENSRLYQDLAERERRLHELVGRLLGAQEEERRRVAYEVHDDLAQVAASAHQHLQAYARRYPPGSRKGEKDLGRALGLVQRTVKESRRIIAGLRPTALDDFGLAAAVAQEVGRLRGEGWTVDYEQELGEERLPAAIETALFRVAQEALTNAHKHADVHRLRVRLSQDEGTVRLLVRDWGQGFDPAALNTEGPGERVGLAGMRERVVLLGGEFELWSRPGEGTSIRVEIPLPASAKKNGRSGG